MNTQLAIVIPAKNEEDNIVPLLRSIANQKYPRIHSTPIYLADANSSDKTVEKARLFASRADLYLEVIPGGLPAVGRNAGARLAVSDYVLFLDADVELAHSRLIDRAIEVMRFDCATLVTTDIHCPDGRWRDKLLYSLNNRAQRWSSLFGTPFSTGMFMMWERKRFLRLGGFHEQALFAEDYMLSKKVHHYEFVVVPGGVNTSNRRFKKMGIPTVAGLFLKTFILGRNDAYFLKDQNYWNPF